MYCLLNLGNIDCNTHIVVIQWLIWNLYFHFLLVNRLYLIICIKISITFTIIINISFSFWNPQSSQTQCIKQQKESLHLTNTDTNPGFTVLTMESWRICVIITPHLNNYIYVCVCMCAKYVKMGIFEGICLSSFLLLLV